MRPRTLLLLACVALLAAALPALAGAAAPIAPGAAAAPPASPECSGIPKCISVAGPWVAVSASGEADYLVECPGGKGLAGGVSYKVTSQQIYVSWDGVVGSPVKTGVSTNYEVFFRALSGNHKPGYFQPLVGCIPTQSSARNTTAVPVLPAGPPLVLNAKQVTIQPGSSRSGSVGCSSGETLVASWTATAFQTPAPPAIGLADRITVRTESTGGRVSATVAASDALPRGQSALVQLGVKCTAG
jgi:hypothetical protein